MTHQPYEDWMFEAPQDLDPQQMLELNSHLALCAGCRALAGSLGQAEALLRRQEQAAPADGFSLRFEERLAAERSRRHNRQTLLTFLLALAGVGGLILGLGGLIWPYRSMLDGSLWAGVYQFISALAVVQMVGQFLSVFLRSAFAALPIALWVLGLGLLSQLAVLWVVSFRVLTNPRRMITNETLS
jgi:predicted anti-sigma-YlaC factor YlaD